MGNVLFFLRRFRNAVKRVLPPSVRRVHRRVRRITYRALPRSLQQTLNDFQYIDTPAETDGTHWQSKGVNVVRSHYWPRLKICFFPEYPLAGSITESRVYRGAIVYQLCRLLGYGIVTDPDDPYDVAFKYERTTFSEELSDQPFHTEAVINGHSTDISKRTVNTTFEEVFGYSLGVDPRTYEDAIVVKSIANGTHDGSEVEGPLSSEEVESDMAYQRVIDNTVAGKEQVVDYRVPIHGDEIPLVFLKYRPFESRFNSESTRATFKETTEVFSEEEQQNILQFARRMGIDFGEFDVLRDNDDGRIYVVDANSVPWGLPRGMNRQDREQSLMRLSRSFQRLIQRYLNHNDPTATPVAFNQRGEDKETGPSSTALSNNQVVNH